MAKASVTERPKAVEALVGITEQAIAFRIAERAPSSSECDCAGTRQEATVGQLIPGELHQGDRSKGRPF